MYIEDKSGGLSGPARIGRVVFSKSGRSLTYGGRTFRKLSGGYKANYMDVDNGDHFWISGPRRDGQDGLHAEVTTADMVDADVADDYWTTIRGKQSAP
ncbi:1-deoxy-D-xylulose-5-phosphate synthase [Phenylobacterium sp.]|uniref:1-deoxy-D-xylulose-5-phosphate synthase n=1 Tax=Phenylobacterium sp. TaxID=1871053 RepID=UPI002C3F2518|nr:1-deoxy-D-xylulose-5-phosphate synthase [Phenylobacterium sp.]HVI34502.1 1-deoxy-D-xylulose-5-phosphate synthase [Phenylobacterium sp.]